MCRTVHNDQSVRSVAIFVFFQGFASELFPLAALECGGSLADALKAHGAIATAVENAVDSLRGGESVSDPNRVAHALIHMNNAVGLDNMIAEHPDDPASVASVIATIWNATIYGDEAGQRTRALRG